MLFLLTLVGCGSQDVATEPPKPKLESAVQAELLSTTWQVRMAVDSARAPFEGRASWMAYFQGKRREAIEAMAGESDPVGLARMHAEYASIYRQAALMAAHATVQVYGADAQPTDPLEVNYLLGVSGALLGDEAWRGRLGGSGASKVQGLPERDAAWKEWADAGAAWPPDELTAAAPGAPDAKAPLLPGAGALPHYEMPERGEGTLAVKGGDPSTLWALSRHHEARANAASAENTGAVRVLIDPWRLPAEPEEGTAGVTFPDTFLFMSAFTTGGDALLLSDLEREGYGAVDKHQSDSPYAVVIARCTQANTIAVDCVLDQSAALGQAIEEGMSAAAGKQESFHRAFADYARVGLLRVADRAAAALADREASGRLRINAYDRSSVGSSHTLDPLFLVSVAAWDASNRNSVRAEEIVHAQLSEVPGLDAARLPLDALHIRLSRNAAPGRPMH